MKGNPGSLLDFLVTPVVVGDPEGYAVYANPCFEAAFDTCGEKVHDQPLAELFRGGGREAVLRAVARVCAGEGATRFRLREGPVGYVALASPIEDETGRVGVMILLFEELQLAEVGALLREDFEGPLGDLEQSLGELSEAFGGRRARGPMATFEDAASAVETLRKRLEEWSVRKRR